MATERILRLSVNNVHNALQFLTGKLGFTAIPPNLTLHGTKELLAKDREGNTYLINDVKNADPAHGDGFGLLNIIDTSDCLKDYFYLSNSGVTVEQSPHYSENALTIKVEDSWGNLYVLIETRNCNEN